MECKSKRVCYKFRAIVPKSMSWIFRLTVEHHKNNIQSKNKNKSTHGPDINGSLEYREMYPLVQNAHIRNLYLCMTATFRNHGDINFNFFFLRICSWLVLHSQRSKLFTTNSPHYSNNIMLEFSSKLLKILYKYTWTHKHRDTQFFGWIIHQTINFTNK